MMSGGVGKYTHIDNQKVSGSVPSVPDPGHVTVQFTADSNLQTFPPSGSQGKISGGTRPPLDADDTFSKPVSGSEESQRGGWFQTFTVAAYKPYFDVDTTDVLERIKYSLFPFRGTFTEKTVNNPDLYGPFWICTTLIFVAASIGTFVTYIAHKLQKKEWNYDINLVTWSAGVFYGYVLLVPLVLYVILKYFSAPAGLVQLFCLYGYSLFVFIPALCLSVIPLEIFRWVIAGVAGFMSATFVALNLRAHIMSAGIRKCELIYSRLVYKNVFPWSQSGCLLLVLLSISAFHHGVVGARNLKENLKAMEETQNEKEGANTEDNNGDVANVNREVPSCPDPIHNR